MKQLNFLNTSEDKCENKDAAHAQSPCPTSLENSGCTDLQRSRVGVGVEDKSKNSEGMESIWKLYVDGASRNNPGKSGAGIYIVKDNKRFSQNGFFLGIKTNNQAEYLALIVGIFFLKKYIGKNDIVMIISDSLLMVKQISGHYKVKNADLLPLFKLSKKLLYGINYNIAHVLRDEKKEADEMANLGIDKGKRLPQDFLDMLREYEIQL